MDTPIETLETNPQKIDTAYAEDVEIIPSSPIDDTAKHIPAVSEQPREKHSLPYWLAKRIKRRPAWVRSLNYWWGWLRRGEWRRKPTEEELAERAENDKRKKMSRMLRFESQRYERAISEALANMGFKYTPQKVVGARTKKVQFARVRYNLDEIWLQVDNNPRHLPAGCVLDDMRDERVLTQLSATCNHRVSAKLDYEHGGLWYIIERSGSIRGIPNHVSYNDVIKRIPKIADSLSYPVGIARNNKIIYASLAKHIHLLVAGAPGGGKSNFLHGLIASITRRNPPERLQLYLVDMKDGMELDMYYNLPHVATYNDKPAIITERQDLADFLEHINQMGKDRNLTIKNAGYNNISRYNARRSTNVMPYMVVLFDEIGDIAMLVGKERARIDELLINALAKYRAAGIYFVLCTQIPKAEVITGRIKGNIPARIAFSVPSNNASMVIIDNGHAKGLHPVGRAIWQYDAEIEVQTPYISPEQIHAYVDDGITFESHQHDVSALEILGFALERLGGKLAFASIWSEFKNRNITADELKKLLTSMDNQQFVIGAGVYKVLPGAGPNPRRLVLSDSAITEVDITAEPGVNTSDTTNEMVPA